uniref:Uncharacterized protein n=1 Tax=Candidatus Kentrum sp. TC TaxID=2126339 RepID=A0A450Z6N9_9GAMM|nr:MAG: hypothetical protein BECKTC1821D_GA0114238_10782 [Candidatus Kentron sp. TC]
MQTVEQIQSNIEALPRAEYARLFHWLYEREAKEWNKEIENDASAGRLDFLMEEAKPNTAQRNLYEAYRNMAEDRVREAEALEWAENTCEDLGHEEG